MAVAKTEQERQIEVNEAAAKAEEAKLQAEMIVPAQKQKERVTIEAEAIKAKAVLEAEAEAAKILKEAEAKADATKLQLEAEAEGTRKKLLAEAEGKRASLMAEADKVQAIEMAPALAVEKMIESGLTPQWWFSTRLLTNWPVLLRHLLRCLNTFTLDRLLFMVMRIPLVISWLRLLRT